MTSSELPVPVPDDDALDAAASAVADGVASPEEAAAVAAAPDGAARVAAMRAVADAVASPVGAQDPPAAATGLAAALAAFDHADADAGAPGHTGAGTAAAAGASVTSLPPPPGARSGRGLSRLAAVAAALVLLVGLGALSVAVLRSGGDDDAASPTALGPREAATEQQAQVPATAGSGPAGVAGPATDTASSATARAAPAPGPAAQARPPEPAANRPPPVVDGGDLGAQSEIEEVAQRTAATLDGDADTVFTAPGAAPPRDVQTCIATGAATANEALGPLRYRAVGTFQGQPAVFLAFDRGGAQPPRLLLVLARTGCAVLASTHF